MSFKPKESRYQLVLFLNHDSCKEIDVVPSSWLSYDSNTKTCYCQYMPGPYEPKNCKIIQGMIKKCDKPLPDWPEYPIEIRGRANTYEEAQKRVQQLLTKPYAYTTENDESAKIQVQKDKKALKIRTNSKNSENLKNKLDSAAIKFTDSTKTQKAIRGKKFESFEIKKASEEDKKHKKISKISLRSSSSSSDRSLVESSDVSYLEKIENSAISKSLKKSKKRKITKKALNNKKFKPHHDSSTDTSTTNSSRNSFASVKSTLEFNSNSLLDNRDEKDVASNEFDSIILTSDEKETVKQSSHESHNETGRIIIKYFKSISKQIGNLNSQMVQNTAEVKLLSEEIKKIKKCFSKNSDYDNYNKSFGNDDNSKDGNIETIENNSKITIDFPCENIEIFIHFDETLSNNLNYRKSVIQRFFHMINKNEKLQKNMSVIIRGYLTREVAMQYVPSKLSNLDKTKKIFKDTEFYKCVVEAMRQKLTSDAKDSLSDKELLDAMATVIRNARDWAGFRLLRLQKTNDN